MTPEEKFMKKFKLVVFLLNDMITYGLKHPESDIGKLMRLS